MNAKLSEGLKNLLLIVTEFSRSMVNEERNMKVSYLINYHINLFCPPGSKCKMTQMCGILVVYMDRNTVYRS